MENLKYMFGICNEFNWQHCYVLLNVTSCDCFMLYQVCHFLGTLVQ